YEVLSDPEKRKRYDQLGPDWKSGERFRPPPGPRPGAEAGRGAPPVSRPLATGRRRRRAARRTTSATSSAETGPVKSASEDSATSSGRSSAAAPARGTARAP